MLSQSKVQHLANGKLVVVKKYSLLGIPKWIIVKTYLWHAYPFTVNPRERLSRELIFFEEGPSSIVRPKVLEADFEQAVMVREYIEGRRLNAYPPDEEDVVKVARALGMIHSECWCLGDVKPDNFLEVGSTFCVVDAEQALKYATVREKAWDIALTLLFSSLATGLGWVGVEKVVERIVEEYTGSGGSIEALRYLSEWKMLFAALMLSPMVVRAFKKAVEKL